jgi:hypothetical protein
MFAEDVELLPAGSFKTLLAKSVEDPTHFAHRLKALWRQMETGEEFSMSLRRACAISTAGCFAKPPCSLSSARRSASCSRPRPSVDGSRPAIFGTLLEQALDPKERRKLGAHYTPRSYVQRLVDVPVMEPLRADWQAGAHEGRGRQGGRRRQARPRHCAGLPSPALRRPGPRSRLRHRNFLYVSLELMKKLEGEVLETLARLGEPESMGLDRETVDPHQFLGLELNPRAAAIAELVVWIGYLQQHYRTRTGHPAEPILRAFENINFGKRQGYDAVLTWDGYPVPKVLEREGKRVETYPKPRRPVWPEAEFIVGNPPFIGGKDLRSRMPPGYAEALWAAHPHMNESADFVMYWWDRSAELLTRKGTPLRRFGLVTTNSISQVFQRRVMERHLNRKPPVSLVFAVPDHPWTKATRDAAAVRIAMTVVEAGSRDGALWEVRPEAGLDTDQPVLGFITRDGRINSDLSVGVDLTKAVPLLANEGLSSPGVKLHGSGFIVSPAQAEQLGLARRPGLERHIRQYRNGRDLTGRSRDLMVIDLFTLPAESVRLSYPEVYQHLMESVLV